MHFSVISIGEAAEGGGHDVTYRAIDGSETTLGTIPREPRAPNGDDLQSWAREHLSSRENYEEVGDYLTGLLGPAKWPRELLRCAHCCRGKPGLHLDVVFHIEPPELRALPWELLRGDGRFLFQKSGHHCVRAFGSPHGLLRGEPEPPTLPIRVLILVGSSSEEISADDEIEGVYRAVRSYPEIWQVKVLHRPEWDDARVLVDAWGPHVLHVISHSANGGAAARMDGERMWWELGAEAIDTLFRSDRARPRLFLLNFCDSAKMVPLLQTGRPGDGSVIAMQADVEGEAAAWFAGALYRRLVEGEEISPATFAGRDVLVAGNLPKEWPLPVLDVAPGCNGVAHGLSEVNRDRNRLRSEYLAEHRAPALGRVQELRVLCEGNPLTGVLGATQTGKSFLALWYLFTRRLLGELTVHLDLRAGEERLERNLTQRQALSMALAAVRRRLDARPGPAGTATKNLEPVFIELEELRSTLDSDSSLITVDEAYDRFVSCLDLVAEQAERDVVFVFDGVEWILSEQRRSFADVMVRHSSDAQSRSRLIAMGRDGLEEFRSSNVPVVELGPFRVEEYLEVGLEAARKFGLVSSEAAERLGDPSRSRAELIESVMRLEKLRTPMYPWNVLMLVHAMYGLEVG